MMDCDKFGQMLDNYESLGESELSELTAHAEECESCRNELDFYRSIINLTASLPALEPPSDLIDGINSRIDNIPESVRKIDRFTNSFRRNPGWYATAAACLAVGVVVGLNGTTIRDRLTDDGTDGVIQTTVTVSDKPDKTESEYDIVESVETEPVHENTATQAPADVPEVLKKAVSEAKPDKAAPRAEAKPTAAPEKRTVKPQPTAASVAAVHETEPAPETATAAPSRYTIARGDYHIPSETEAPTPEPADDPIEIKEESYQIAMGVYEIPEEKKKELAKNILVVNESDIRHVFDLILATGIKGTTTGYVGTESAVQELLAKLDAEGLYYNYLECSETNGEVAFKLYAN